MRAIDNVGVFRCYIYPNQCTDASALPVISRSVDRTADAVSGQIMYAVIFLSRDLKEARAIEPGRILSARLLREEFQAPFSRPDIPRLQHLKISPSRLRFILVIRS